MQYHVITLLCDSDNSMESDATIEKKQQPLLKLSRFMNLTPVVDDNSYSSKEEELITAVVLSSESWVPSSPWIYSCVGRNWKTAKWNGPNETLISDGDRVTCNYQHANRFTNGLHQS